MNYIINTAFAAFTILGSMPAIMLIAEKLGQHDIAMSIGKVFVAVMGWK